MNEWDIVWLGFTASLLAGLGTSVGAACIALVKRLSGRQEDALLSFAAGIMLAASFFSLLGGFAVMMMLDTTLG